MTEKIEKRDTLDSRDITERLEELQSSFETWIDEIIETAITENRQSPKKEDFTVDDWAELDEDGEELNALKKEVHPMKAITIKFAGPTNTNGSRWIVSDSDHRRIVPRRYELERQEEHERALELFRAKFRPNAKKPTDYATAEYKGDDIYIPLFD